MITSTSNPQIKQIIKLKKASERKKHNLIVIEGQKEISLAQAAGHELECLYFSKELAGLAKIETKANIEELDKKVFMKISYRENPDGLLAVAKPRYLDINSIELSATPLIIILENVEKPGNLGAVLRTADAVSADAVIACAPQTDIYNPNVIRASLGTVFTNQVVVSGNQTVIEWLKEKRIKLYASSPNAKEAYTAVDYLQPCAIVIGAEHEGLSNEWLEQAGHSIKIPMRGQVDSLNASVSAAVILYEAIRQRSHKGLKEKI